MANVTKENAVTYDDQQKINKFARVNARLQDLKDDLESKKKEMENLEDAESEILMSTDDEPVPFLIGEVFVLGDQEETGTLLEEAKSTMQRDIEALQAKSQEYKAILSELKVQLYAKFGNNINLEAEED